MQQVQAGIAASHGRDENRVAAAVDVAQPTFAFYWTPNLEEPAMLESRNRDAAATLNARVVGQHGVAPSRERIRPVGNVHSRVGGHHHERSALPLVLEACGVPRRHLDPIEIMKPEADIRLRKHGTVAGRRTRSSGGAWLDVTAAVPHVHAPALLGARRHYGED